MKKYNADFDFFKLSQKEQEKMFEKATKEANKEQLKLVKEYEKKFGKTKFVNA